MSDDHRTTEHLETVHDYVRSVRTLLLDKVHPHRYKDHEIVAALNNALLRARTLRADLFLRHHGRVPAFFEDDDAEVHFEPQFRLGLVYGIAWQVLARDEDDIQDARANSFRAQFEEMLTGKSMGPPAPLQGGSVPPGNAQR